MRSLAFILLCSLCALTFAGCQRVTKPPVMGDIAMGPYDAIEELLWLPDNRTLLLTAKSEGELRLHLLDVFSGEERKLDQVAGEQLEPAINRQGTLVAYVGGVGAPELYLHDLSSQRTNALVLPLSGDYPFDPKFSPNGKFIAFYAVVGRSDSHSDIYQSVWLYNLSSQSAVLVSPTGGSVRLIGFSENSSHLYYLYTYAHHIHSHSFRYDLWEVNTATNQQRKLSEGGLFHNFASATKDPIGQRFVFGTWEAVDIEYNIILRPRFLYSFDIPTVKLLPIIATGRNGDPQFSPNGKQILFRSDRGTNGSVQDLYLMDHEGKNVKQLTFSGSPKKSARWSGDGKLIAFIAMRGEIPEIVVMDARGTMLRRVTQSSPSPGK